MIAKKISRRNVVKYAALGAVGVTIFNSAPIALEFITPNPEWPLPPGQVRPGATRIVSLSELFPGAFITYKFNFGRATLIGGLWFFDEKVSHQRRDVVQGVGRDISGGHNENIDVPEGLVSYCLLCTHLGCIPKKWNPQTGILTCPCHNGLYDIVNGAAVVGGPPPAPIPEIKLEGRGGDVWAVGWKDINYVKSLDVYRNKGVV